MYLAKGREIPDKISYELVTSPIRAICPAYLTFLKLEHIWKYLSTLLRFPVISSLFSPNILISALSNVLRLGQGRKLHANTERDRNCSFLF
jgi:hypothetical protein